MDEIVQEFLVETSENLDQLDRDLVALESEPGSRELLGSVFRTFHTIKGATGFLGFDRLEHLSHVAENLLSKLRDGALELTSERAGVLLEVVDEVRGLLRAIEETGAEDERDHGALIEKLTRLLDGDAGPAHPPVEPSPQTTKLVRLAPPPPPGWMPDPAPTPEPGPIAAPRRSPPQGRPPSTTAGEEAPPGYLDGSRGTGDRSVRVDVALLDVLMRQVGELVLARNQIISHADQLDDHPLHQTVQRLNLIVSELQEGVMKTRMQPIDHLWAKLPRVVRDLGTQFSKTVVLEMDGGETELDRSLLEAVKDPLVHLVRNAIDHGIERPEVRRSVGKPPHGVLSLRAFHEGGQVVLSVTDDGAGIDPRRLAARAAERGILGAERLASMSEREVMDLIFQPGFSTAAVVTNISGRGVGMDVVRTNIECIGGTVDVASVPGEGTAFRMKIPLTLAIIPALLVGCRGTRFAIPQASLLELVHVDRDRAVSSIEHINEAAFYRLRGRLLPLVGLDALLGYEPAPDGRGAVNIIVLQADDVLFGLVVDAVHESQEIVVKPLGRQVKQIPLFAGATILGDGDVALILDVPGLASAAAIHEADELRAAHDAQEGPSGRDDTSIEESLVVLRVGASRRVALPLGAVARLEHVPSESIEQAGGRPVLQYRGSLLPLVRLDELLDEQVDTASTTGTLGAETARRSARVPIVVLADGDRQVGFIASEILDIVSGHFTVRIDDPRRGVVGSAVLQGKVTDLLDAHGASSLARREVLADAV